MKEVSIDVRSEVCTDAVEKIKNVFLQLKEENIAVSKIEIFGDDMQSLEGVENFLINWGYIFERIGDEKGFQIFIKGREERNSFLKEESMAQELEVIAQEDSVFEDKILLLKDDAVGVGELGKKVMDNLLHNLANSPILPKEIVFMNRAILLCADVNRYTEVIKDLSMLQKRGVKLLVCKTCVEYFNLVDHLIVGEISTGDVVLEKMLRSQDVISF